MHVAQSVGRALGRCDLRAAESAEPSKYTGPGSCSSPSCHGGVQARDQTTVLQNEYSTWVVRDKHAHAFVNLTNPVGTRIAKIMGLPQPRHGAALSGLPCAGRSGRPARPHLRSHRRRGLRELPRAGVGLAGAAHHARMEVRQVASSSGMYDTRDLIKRSEKCLTCHLGTPEKSVDHELIAAGHPDLYFELDSFMSVMPPHWKEVDNDPWFGVRAMAVGQAVQIARAAQARRARIAKRHLARVRASWIASPAITI